MNKKIIFSQKKIGFIGSGNMTHAMVRALLNSNTFEPHQVFATNRTPRKLEKLKDEFSIQTIDNNETLVEQCDIVVFAVKPQDLPAAIEPIANSFNETQTLISIAASISLEKLHKAIPDSKNIFRLMPNTPVGISQGVVAYTTKYLNNPLCSIIEELFGCFGLVIKVEEGDALEAVTVGSGSGIGFVFELMQYWQEWFEEHEIEPLQARKLTVQTFLGAALLAESAQSSEILQLQKKVTSKKGGTEAGLASMRELEIERLLRYSFEKAAIRYRQLAE